MHLVNSQSASLSKLMGTSHHQVFIPLSSRKLLSLVLRVLWSFYSLHSLLNSWQSLFYSHIHSLNRNGAFITLSEGCYSCCGFEFWSVGLPASSLRCRWCIPRQTWWHWLLWYVHILYCKFLNGAHPTILTIYSKMIPPTDMSTTKTRPMHLAFMAWPL